MRGALYVARDAVGIAIAEGGVLRDATSIGVGLSPTAISRAFLKLLARLEGCTSLVVSGALSAGRTLVDLVSGLTRTPVRSISRASFRDTLSKGRKASIVQLTAAAHGLSASLLPHALTDAAALAVALLEIDCRESLGMGLRQGRTV